MKIIETDETVVINGYEIEGHIDYELVCASCGCERIFHEMYDSFFCPRCNEWLEVTCEYPDCSYCAKRPKRPLPRRWKFFK